PLEILQLGRLDFAVHLGQSLFAAHRQDRMREGKKQPQDTDCTQEAKRWNLAKETQRVLYHAHFPTGHLADFVDRLVLLGNRVALGVELGLEGIGTAWVAYPD